MSSEIGMTNAEGMMVDNFIPRKCSATNNIIGPKDHNSIQINIAQLNDDCKYKSNTVAFAISGPVRKAGNSDAAFNLLAQKAGLIKLE
ncbi:Ribosomal protein S21 [Spironucleus salmonicida]|uniref:40S ribosomal protein S21 n=1 Tax=Spironucleus salmonicida TaxID=348837 RepID=V6LK35_9EUKA|nr:40S ribosomal protein S21 [Spironucleus salmonicida]KAH0571979.1 Ribosomal protein S21 [Spironucleus salmonicida]|eukprot:EST44912.1 Ribosomal protein S21 [Spironucleus salmonicida]